MAGDRGEDQEASRREQEEEEAAHPAKRAHYEA
jgi:hypothetical protein